MNAAASFRFAVVLGLGSLLGGLVTAATIDSKEFRAGDLFQIAKVWSVDFVLTPDQWKIMTPKYATPGSTAPHNDAGTQFDWAHAALKIESKKFDDLAVRYKGNNTFRVGSRIGKISLKIDLNKYVKGQKLGGLTKLNFHNNVDDPGWMNEVLAYQVFRDAGVPAPRTSYARLYVTIAGESDRKYWGLYSIVEDVDSNFTADRFGMKGGLLLKPVTQRLFQYFGDDWTRYAQIYDPKEEPSDEQKQRVIDFCKFVTNAPDDEFAAKLGNYVDLDEFARFMGVIAGMADLDSILDMGKNFYVWLNPETRKFSFIPWDQDHSFGQYPSGQQRTLSIEHPFYGNNPFLQRVFAVPAFRAKYMARMAEFSKTFFRPERIVALVNEIAPAIRPAIAEESAAKLKQFDAVASDDAADASMESVKRFVKARAQSVADQLAGKSSGTLPGPQFITVFPQ